MKKLIEGSVSPSAIGNVLVSEIINGIADFEAGDRFTAELEFRVFVTMRRDANPVCTLIKLGGE